MEDDMNPDLDEAIRHAVMANHDGHLKAIAILMINEQGMPEIHFRVPTDLAFELNAGLDMMKVEVLKMMNMRMEGMKPRE